VARGFSYTGRLPPIKARLLLALMLASDIPRAEIETLWLDLN
jgi:hypothetical protein